MQPIDSFAAIPKWQPPATAANGGQIIPPHRSLNPRKNVVPAKTIPYLKPEPPQHLVILFNHLLLRSLAVEHTARWVTVWTGRTDRIRRRKNFDQDLGVIS
jgi:hypothetical protein